MRKKKFFAVVAALGVGGLLFAACNSGPSNNAVQREQQTSTSILNQLLTAQPIPAFKWSQLRQTLIDIETAQADTTQTTTFFFNQGVTDPVNSCPSVGFPVASTTELSNPQQTVNDGYPNGGAVVTLPQIDPNGVYAGDSSGTYVLCVSASGQTYGVYWEGFVYALTGPAVWNPTTNSVTPTGPSSFKFSTAKP